MTREEAIDLLGCIYMEVSTDADKEAVDMAIEALKNIQVLDKIPKYYIYDAETEKFLVYRHKYTGKEIHILKPTDMFVLERPHGEWIPVEERLPKPDKYVLVCSDEGYIEVAEGFISTEIEEFVWLTSGWRFGEVIAWMPLPEPYKKEGET